MPEIRFYHLERTGLAEALPGLLAKATERGMRAVVRTGSPEAAEGLSAALWQAGGPTGFLAHGTPADGRAPHQPIWLTAEDERPNQAELLVLVAGAEPPPALDAYSLVCAMFDGGDPEELAAARAHWKTFKAAGHACTYWQQGPRGGWEKKAG